MTFVSYAQNFEDVMLWRALGHIEAGFYIDVGAAWPDEHSVTHAFYERGWRGVNVEPNPELHRQLQEQRPEDRNLRVAVSDKSGIQEMSIVAGTGLSTLDDAIAGQHQTAGRDTDRQQVQVVTLAEIWKQQVPDGRDVHFLKVDVEGLELAVLRGNDWSQNRPWIVLAEATLPSTQIEAHHDWEPLLLDAGYRFVYADGLNRFYIATEHLDLLPAFRYPPNVFDGFIPCAQQAAESRATAAESRATAAESRATAAESRADDADKRATLAVEYASAIVNSASWRITAPLRWMRVFSKIPAPTAEIHEGTADPSRPDTGMRNRDG